MNDLLKEVKRLLLEAGKMALAGLENPYESFKKGSADFVTTYDLKVEVHLKEGLSALLPDAGFLAEESGSSSLGGTYHWVIDPIDGTTNFMHGFPMFCHAVALMKNNKPVLAAIYNPSTKEMFSALEGNGAYLNERPIHVSACKDLSMALVAIGFPYERTNISSWMEKITKILQAAHGLRRPGSASLDFCYVACGRLDAFVEGNLQPWDFTPGSLILKEAGGQPLNWKGEELIYGGRSNILANNGNLSKLLLEVMS